LSGPGGTDPPARWLHELSENRPAPGLDAVIAGLGAVRSALAPTAERLGIRRPMVVCGANLARSPLLGVVLAALGRHVVVYDGSLPHTPWATVDAGAALARRAGIDGLVALGGSSAVDCAKGIGTLLATGTTSVRDLAPATFGRLGGTAPARLGDPMAVLVVTTTLSFAEFLPFWGALHDEERRKVPYLDQGALARTVILDGEMAATTPDEVWLATGIKALDDAMFSFCRSDEAEPFGDPVLLAAIRALVTWLPASRGPEAVDARHRLLVATWMTKATLPRLGRASLSGWLSTAARHALGGVYRLPHGVGSCVALGPGLRFHRAATAGRQATLAGALGWSAAPQEAPLGPGVDTLLAELGLPTRLGSLGVDLDRIDDVVDAIVDESPGLGPTGAIRRACRGMR